MRIVILSATTGGGHNVRAHALIEWIHTLNIGQATLWLPLEESHPLYRFGVRLYNGIQRQAPFLHHGYFLFLEIAGLFKTATRVGGKKTFFARLESEKPDVLVSVHGSTNHAFMDLARQVLHRRVRCVTYCGELSGGYGFSRHWVNPANDWFLCPVEETAQAARQLGMPEKKVKKVGFLLRPSFYLPQLSESERARGRLKLGLGEDRFTLLLATGFNAAQRHLVFLEALARARLPIQAIVLCGKDVLLKRRIEQWARTHEELPVVPLGFVREMAWLLQLADAVLTRPGAGTCSEAIQCGTPLLLARWGGWMPQELLNVRFCLNHGIGEPVGSARELVERVIRWIETPELVRSVRQRMEQVRPRESPPTWIQELLLP
ncbi:glycosyltransferase [Candidatus Methylacidithermus pantelleriae]|uniref:Processive 1,2-diacylglycerol beta-glucosyltransferase n=1 Tax=Candidatus Methylacidithermus pantelleriae TaxID=2744239 RepID=A0A8J2BR09_9BACT|nr:glycosyltransferase [Candidatus Methylacidithermus pantelleriae]CAF0692022.1 Processive 1,2-diacylglycerol beta-glucosyltransferase [Candidatus Methylacidithermus pantelleriae]